MNTTIEYLVILLMLCGSCTLHTNKRKVIGLYVYFNFHHLQMTVRYVPAMTKNVLFWKAFEYLNIKNYSD